jgi:hypothetical protein
VEIFSWATIGLGDRRAARSDPPPPLLAVINRIKICHMCSFVIYLHCFLSNDERTIMIMSNSPCANIYLV